ncbi:hypothetical protein V5E97_21840 [Singulisphaera sp. Ch08]|uniref:Uncharacterized protein n=1 Tax=Singulisphaera sp. Ch08 TaxID=3120278 RepID=A0AAU7C785_9BACT
MRRPKFQIRALMIVVAIVALECWLLVRHPFVGMLLFGPLIGSPLLGSLSRDRLNGLLLGGIVGGLIETGLIVIFMEGTEYFQPSIAGAWRSNYGPLLAVNTLAGFGVGLTFAALYAFRIAVTSPASTFEVNDTPLPDKDPMSVHSTH